MFTPSVFYVKPMAALRWLEQAFGFETTMLIEGPDGDERMMHSEMSISGEGRIMVGSEWASWTKSPRSIGGTNTQSVSVELESGIDEHCARARAAGAVVEQEPENQFYGHRTYRCRDLEGHVWTFSQKVKDLTIGEMEQAGGVVIKNSL